MFNDWQVLSHSKPSFSLLIECITTNILEQKSNIINSIVEKRIKLETIK